TKRFERVRAEQFKRKLLADAERAFAAKQHEEALELVNRAGQSASPNWMEKQWVLKGQVLAELNRSGESVQAFRNAMALDPEVQLLTPASSEQKKLFERARYETRHPLQPFAWLAAGAGVVVAGENAFCLVQARGVEQRLRTSDPSITTVLQRQDAV